MKQLSEHDYLFLFLFSKVKSTSFYGFCISIYKYFKKFFVFTRIIKWLFIIIRIIETSIVLIFFVGVLLLFLPIAFIFAIILGIYCIRAENRALNNIELKKSILGKKRVYIITSAGEFGKGLAKSFLNDNTVVLVLWPSLRSRFVCYKITDGVIYIRYHFFFRVKRELFKTMSDVTEFVYLS